MEYRTKLINLIETNYARMEMEKTRFSVACHAYKRGVSCLNNLGLGQKLIGATIKGKRGSQYSIFLDGNGDGVQQKNESTLSSTNKLMAPISDTILLFKGSEGTTRTG